MMISICLLWYIRTFNEKLELIDNFVAVQIIIFSNIKLSEGFEIDKFDVLKIVVVFQGQSASDIFDVWKVKCLEVRVAHLFEYKCWETKNKLIHKMQ